MFLKNILCVLALSTIVLMPSAFAGKVELTTYYPAPYGDYKNLNSTEDAHFATASGNVGIGTTTPVAKLDVNGEVKVGDTGLACEASTAGAMRYSSGRIQYCDNNNWQEVGNPTPYELSPQSASYDTPFTPPTFEFVFTAQKTGRALILAKGDINGVSGGTWQVSLFLSGALIDTGRYQIWSGHAGSRSFSLMGHWDLTQGTTYTVTVSSNAPGSAGETMYNPRIVVLYS